MASILKCKYINFLQSLTIAPAVSKPLIFLSPSTDSWHYRYAPPRQAYRDPLPLHSYPGNDKGISTGLSVAEKARHKSQTRMAVTQECYSDNETVAEAPVMTCPVTGFIGMRQRYLILTTLCFLSFQLHEQMVSQQQFHLLLTCVKGLKRQLP